MTKNLFDEFPYESSFESTVVECQPMEEGLYKLVLEETLFFPEQGGQSCDVGKINEIEVVDVQVEGGIIYHVLRSYIEPLAKIAGEIDFDHRFNNMQQHTGEHIFTGLAHRKYGAENVGFHLSDNTVTLDLNVELDESKIRELELEANKIIAMNKPIRCWYPTPEELETIDYRSKKALEGAVRLVEIEDTDICACCAPHVATTGGVGMLKVIDFEKYKGGTRVYILCGLRALEDYNKKQTLIRETYRNLNCSEEEIPSKAKELINGSKELRFEISKMKADQLMATIETYPSEIKDITIFSEKLDAKIMRDGVNALVEKHEGLCAIFNGNDDEGYSFVIGSKTRDCGAIVAGLRELLGAKGGGSKPMAQGSVSCSRNEIEHCL